MISMKYVENEKFNYLVKLALLDCGKKDAEMFRTIDTSNAVVSDRFRNKIHRLIKRKARESAVKKTKLILSRIAIAAMLVLSIIFATMMSISAIREAIWKTIVEWYDNYITIRYEVPENDADKDSNSNNNAAIGDSTNQTDANGEETTEQITGITPPTEILEVRKPTYMPDGVVEDVVMNMKSMVIVDYYLGEELIYSFNQYILKTDDKYYDNQNANIFNVKIKGKEAIFVTYEEKIEKYLIWNDGEYSYVVASTYVSFEKMVRIAESVQ